MPINTVSPRVAETRDSRRASPVDECSAGVAEHILPPDRFLRLPDVTAMTGLSVSHLYELMSDKKFPQNISLSDRVVVWSQREVLNWQAAKMATRDNVSDRPTSKHRKAGLKGVNNG
jgi:prophage regulatory protein